MVSFKAAAFLSNKLNALPKQFKPPPQIAAHPTKNLSFKWNYSSMNVFVCQRVEGGLKRPQLHLNGYFSCLTVVTVSHLVNSPVFSSLCPLNSTLKQQFEVLMGVLEKKNCNYLLLKWEAAAFSGEEKLCFVWVRSSNKNQPRSFSSLRMGSLVHDRCQKTQNRKCCFMTQETLQMWLQHKGPQKFCLYCHFYTIPQLLCSCSQKEVVF